MTAWRWRWIRARHRGSISSGRPSTGSRAARAGRAGGGPAARRSRRLGRGLTWGAPAYASLLVVGAGMRFWGLGSRALHHDESLHGFYSYQLYQGNGYEHNPLMHGPFQFFGTALTFFLSGGASDYTVRVLPAFFG